jgi:DNA-binding IclR family transcriptional regulator
MVQAMAMSAAGGGLAHAFVYDVRAVALPVAVHNGEHVAAMGALGDMRHLHLR